MPSYDYKCPKCHKEFEITRSTTDETPVKCDCGAIAHRHFVSGGSCGITGMGFYQERSVR